MRAVVHTGPRRIEVVEVPEPVPGPRQAVVDMRVSGICGSDLHTYRREALAGVVPVPMGHEPCGVVSAVGECVTHIAPGERVSVYHYESCGACQDCHRGDWMWCRNRGDTGILGWNTPGAFQDRLLVNACNCLPLPAALNDVDGAFIACGAGTTWSALLKVEPTETDTAVVFGLGPIGLLGVMFLRAFGVRVIGVGRRAARLDMAVRLGAEDVVDVDACDEVFSALRRLCPDGISLAYETSGAVRAQADMLKVLDRGARAVCVGLGSDEPAVNLNHIAGRQLRLFGSFVMNVGEYENLTRFIMANQLDLSSLVSHRFSLDDAQQAYETADRGDCTKVIFEWPVA